MGANRVNGSKGAGKTYREWFWEGVDVPEDGNRYACWLWKRKAKSPGGYGLFKRKYAHRVSYELEHGPIGKCLLVCHQCDNPLCVNPHHLFLGTQADNMADAKIKMRTRSKYARLTVAQVLEVRKLREQGVPYEELSARFGISEPSICDVIKRRTYSWVL